MSQIRVFVSFDVEHDGELFEQLRSQSRSFGIVASSRPSRCPPPEVWERGLRRQIREADQVIVICGQHTDASASVGAELRIAQQEGTPYFLLWGRREIMCTKPMGARPADGMYSWTPEILQNQIAFTTRSAYADAIAETLRNDRKS